MTQAPEEAPEEVGARRGSVAKLAASSYLGTALGLLTGPLVARALGPEGRGEYAAVMSYSALLVLVFGIGFGQTMNYAQLTLKWDREVVLATAVRFALWLTPLALVAAGVVMWLGLLPPDANWALAVSALLIPVSILQQCSFNLLVGMGDLKAIALLQLSPVLFSAVGVVLLFPLGLLTTASFLALTVVGGLLNFALTLRLLGVRPRRGRSPLRLMGFGLRAFPGGLSHLANSQLDQLLVAPVLGTRDLGIYAAAVTVAGIPLGLAQALGARSVRDNAAPEGGLDPRRTELSIRRVAVAVAVLAVALACVVPWLVPLLYGAPFRDSAPLAMVLLLGTVANGVYGVAGTSLTIAGRPGVQSWAQIGGVVITGAGLAVLLPTIGVMGAAITSVAAYWTRLAFVLVALRREGVRDVRPRWADVVGFVCLIVDRLRLRALVARLRRRSRGVGDAGGAEVSAGDRRE